MTERQDRWQEPWIGCVACLRGTQTSADGLHVHKLVEGELVSLVHARHPGGKCGLVLRVCLVAEVMEVGGGKETLLIGHRINLLADVGCRHERNDAPLGSIFKHQNRPRHSRLMCPIFDEDAWRASR